MTYSLITHFTALKATHYLLELDLTAIDERYRQDAQSWIQNLQAALQIYKLQTQKNFNTPSTIQEDSQRINQSLIRLTNYANSMVYILTLDAKEALAQYLIAIEDIAA